MSVNKSEDCAIIREVLSGRTDAFRPLVERYFATVRLVALAKTGNVADAEDVAQETFIKAYETLGVLRNRERLAPWLVAIVRNLAVSLVRRRERERRAVQGYVRRRKRWPGAPEHRSAADTGGGLLCFRVRNSFKIYS